MSRVAYVAGPYLPHPVAAAHLEDRGYDGVPVANGKPGPLAGKLREFHLAHRAAA